MSTAPLLPFGLAGAPQQAYQQQQEQVYNIPFLDPSSGRVGNSQITESIYWRTQENVALYDVTYFD